MNTKLSRTELFLTVILALSFIALGVLGYSYYKLKSTHIKNVLTFTEEKKAYETKIGSLETELVNSINENNELAQELDEEKNRNEEFEEQINEIAGTVGTLEKLSKTDKELLQKYSKIYFLNEHYIPQGIVQIDKDYTFQEKESWIHKQVEPFLENMLNKAKKDGIDLKVISAYRSFDEQVDVKEGHVVVYGSGTANQFSAEQGYSEHQLGTTVDLTTPEVGGTYTSFKDTEAYEWLTKNAYKYGFTLSYPENNSYYIYEPWHWRFVGTDLARELHNDGKYFYDLEQRDIDKYLISLFD